MPPAPPGNLTPVEALKRASIRIVFTDGTETSYQDVEIASDKVCLEILEREDRVSIVFPLANIRSYQIFEDTHGRAKAGR